MGAKDLRDAFNEVTGRQASCMRAFLEYETANDTQWQVLIFSGNYPDGTGFSIKSDRLRPDTDVNQAARATAERLLQQKGAA